MLIRFGDFPRWKRVEAVNEQTGKVGIAASGYHSKREAADGASSVAVLVGNLDMAERIRDPRKYRWVDPRHIIQVRPAAQQAVV